MDIKRDTYFLVTHDTYANIGARQHTTLTSKRRPSKRTSVLRTNELLTVLHTAPTIKNRIHRHMPG